MQGVSEEILGRFLTAGFDEAGKQAAPELRRQAELLTRDPARRFTSNELVALAQAHDPSFKPRTLADWPGYGLLAEAEREGRGPSRGVGRSWTAPQAIVFLSVVRLRKDGKRRRSDLANVPVFLWLVFGEDYVPLGQVRRALATWAAAVPRLSERRFRVDLYHHLLRHPDIQARLESGLESKEGLQAQLRQAPHAAQRQHVPEFFAAVLRSDPASSETIADAAARYQLSQAELDRGIALLPDAPDSILRTARLLYLHGNIQTPISAGKFPSQEQLQRHARSELTTSSANVLTYLTRAADEVEAARFAAASASTSIAYSRLMALLALAENQARESIDRSWNRRTKRLGVRKVRRRT
jgi:hypothetical protein